jgi:hypothetical protein
VPYTYAEVNAGDRIRYKTAGLQVRAEGGRVIGRTVAGTEGTVIGHGGGRLAAAGWRLTRPDAYEPSLGDPAAYSPSAGGPPAPPPEGATCLLHPLNFEAL